MSWEDKYTLEELKAGYMLYKNGKIRSKIKKGSSYSVKVSEYYTPENVTVECEKNGYKANCSCWDFRYAKKCRHCIAAIYSVDIKMEDIPLSEQKVITPFGSINDEEYHYYDMAKIMSRAKVAKYKYDKAKKMLENKNIELRQISNFAYNDGEQEYNGLKCQIAVKNPEDEKEQGAGITVGKDFLWEGLCQAKRCYHKYQYMEMEIGTDEVLCEHMLAAAILLEQYIEKENPGDATDRQAKHFMDWFRRQNNSSSEKNANVNLQPELQNNDGELRASFRIGADKLYKVKNLADLVEHYEKKDTYVLGKNASISFGIQEFDEYSHKIFSLIRKQVKDNQQRNERIEARKSWGYFINYGEDIIKDTLLLEGTALDEFYRLCENLIEIPYVDKQRGNKAIKSKVKCNEGAPKVKIHMKELKYGTELEGLNMSGKLPQLYKGTKGIYCIENQFFMKTSEEVYEQLMPLVELADREGYFSINVGRRHLADFYHKVYPALEKVATINDRATEKIEAIIPPAVDFVFYLDSVNNVLFCKAEAIYGEISHSPLEAVQKKQFSQIYRDYQREREVLDVIEEFFPLIDEENKEARCDDAEECYRVYREGIDELLKYGEIQCTDRFQSRKVRNNFGVKIGVSVESDLLNLEITSKELTRDELMEIFDSYKLKKKYHVLHNGDFIDLESPDLELLNRIFSACRVELKDILGDKIQIPMYRSLYLDKLLEEHEELYSHRDRNFRNLIKDFGMIRDSDLEIPDTLEDTLRTYQVYGHRWLRTVMHNNFGGILADEMGLGKTLQVISVLLAEKENESKPALIVCPASLVYNWKEEFQRFAPTLKVQTVAGGAKERQKQLQEYKETDVLITSYDLLKRDIAQYQDLNFEYEILDEAQFIKNAKTAAAKTVKVISAKHKIALTGTPIENRLSELWSIFDFLMPGFLHNYETFRKEYEIPITKDKDSVSSEQLKKMIAPFVLRRLKKDVLKDLPDKIEEIRYGVMEEQQKKLYNAQIARITKQVEEDSESEFRRSKLEILSEITRTRQICCDPSLVLENYQGGSAKREACIELIKSAIEGEHRILLFSQFTSMLELLCNDLKSEGIEYYKLTGETPKEERIRLMKEFNEGSTPVFLISLKAGGTGLNLTGADVVIHYDPWWNLAVQNQATDRAHRIGQTKNVTVYKLIVKDSIEEKIVKLQETKKDLAEEVLNGENGTLSAMTREDLLELLR